ncbi:MAG: fibronectin type III domain-containing protein [Bacteroidota bacterium]
MRIGYTLLFFISFCCSFSFAIPPSSPASNLQFSNINGDRMTLIWANGNGSRRIVAASSSGPITGMPVDGIDYNASSTFGTADQLNPGEFVVLDGSNSSMVVVGLTPATTYYFAIFEYNGSGFSTEYLTTSFESGSQATASSPTIQTSNLSFSNVTGNSMTLSWSNGDGDGRLVLVREGSAVDTNPSNLGIFNPNSSFGSGTQLGTGNYVVYESTGTTVTISNLSPGTTYHVAVYEYNGVLGQVFLTPAATASQLTATAPSVPASNITFNLIQGNFMRVQWTSGNGGRRIVVMREGAPVIGIPTDGIDYSASNFFGNGDQIAAGEYVVYDNFGSLVDVQGLSPSTTYHFAIFEYNGTGSNTYYLTTSTLTASQASLSAPATQASGVGFSNVTGSSMQISWTNGNGSGRLVVLREGSAVNANPVDLASYGANASFGSGTQIGTGNYVVYKSTGSSVTVTNLQPASTYHIAIYEYNGTFGQVFLVPGATGSQVTGGAPTVSTSNFTFSQIQGNFLRIQWTNGNGSRRLVVARAGAPVSSAPSNGVSYSASTTFGNGDALGAGEFVVYNNAFSLLNLGGLSPSTVYHFAFFEYNGTGANTIYQLIGFASASQSTVSAPTVQVGGISFSNITGSSMQISWTNGNGAGRQVVMRANGSVDSDPMDLVNYIGNSNFGSGTQVGTGNYTVYRSSGNTVTVTNLQPGTTYHVAIYEHNGTSSLGRVYLRPGATASQATGGAPTLSASNPNFNFIEASSMRMVWTNGGGARRLVVARAGSPVSGLPGNGTTYAANSVFGSGDQLGSGEFVIYDGTSSLLDITGLSVSTTYHFAIFEYNGTGASSLYQQVGFLTASQSTATPPSVQASNLNITNVTGTSLQLNWTNGDGNGRIVLVKEGSPVDNDPASGTGYSPNSSFGTGSQIGTGNYVVYRAIGTNITISNLTPNFIYHFAIYEYNGSSSPAYLTPGATISATTVATPTMQASNMTYPATGYDAMHLQWTNGNGSRRIVLAKAGSPVDASPVNGTAYSASSTFGLGDQLGIGNFVVHDGVLDNVMLSGLTPGQTYHFSVFEYGGLGGTSSYLTPGLIASQSLAIAPGSAPSNLTFPTINTNSIHLSWTNGSGAERMVIATQGATLSISPQSGQNYTASTSFGSGTAVGNGFVIYQGSASTAIVNTLLAGIVYRFYVFEYNGTAASPAINPTALSGSEVSLGAPAIQVSSPLVSNILPNSVTIDWTNGGGQNRLVVMRLGSPVSGSPTDGVAYAANSAFGAGDQVSPFELAVFAGSGSSVTVTNLNSGTNYEVAIYEYNGSGAATLYNRNSPATVSFTTQASFPVEWLGIAALWVEQEAVISWQTASESQTDRFVVERKAPSQNWITLGTISAAGNSSELREYSWRDPQAFSGAWYRIRQVDLDGQWSYSSIVELNDKVLDIRLFPNPAKKKVQVMIEAEGPIFWRLHDLHGRLIQRGVLDEQRSAIPLEHLTDGMYLMNIRTLKGIHLQRRLLISR